MTSTLPHAFRALDPAADDRAQPDEALLSDILATPAPSTGRPGRKRRRLAFVAVTAAVASCAVLAGVALTPSSVDVVAAADEALSGPDTILHYRTEWRIDPAGTRLGSFETWQEADGPRARQIIDDVHLVEPIDDVHLVEPRHVHERRPPLEVARTARSHEVYMPDENTLQILKGDVRNAKPAFGPVGLEEAGDLSTLFERATSGRIDADELGETEVRGVAVHELRIGPDPRPCEELKGEFSRGREPFAPVHVYVDTKRYEPVRAIVWPCRAGGELVRGVTVDYTSFERLPRTPDNERLLRMSPHPGAKRIIERIE